MPRSAGGRPSAREYIQFIEEQTGVPVALIGVGPGHEQVIWTEAGRESIVGPSTGASAAA
jgi:adenylosuccinate synthase